MLDDGTFSPKFCRLKLVVQEFECRHIIYLDLFNVFIFVDKDSLKIKLVVEELECGHIIDLGLWPLMKTHFVTSGPGMLPVLRSVKYSQNIQAL